MLKDRQELRAFREECVRAYNAYKRKILVCAGTGCVSSGSLNIYARLRELIEAKGIHCAVELEHEPESEGVALKKSGCHGFCERGPLVRIEPEGWLYTKVKVEDCEEIVEKTIVNGEHIERLAFQKTARSTRPRRRSRSTRSRPESFWSTAVILIPSQSRSTSHKAAILRLKRLCST